MIAAQTAVPQLTIQIPTETNKGGPNSSPTAS
jgi:hypothetical protein